MKKIIPIILITLLVYSCISEKQVKKFIIDNPATLTDLCPKNDTIIKFFQTTHTDTIIKVQEEQNGNAELIEMIYNDSLLSLKEKLFKLSQIKPCKDKIITKIIHTTDSIIVENKLKYQEADKIGYDRGIKEQESRNHSWIWILTTCLLSGLLITILIGWVRKK